MAAEHPPSTLVAVAALCAAGCVWSFANGHLDAQWVLWLALFLVLELTAAVSHQPGDTFSERVWHWFGLRPPRASRLVRVPVVGVFMAILGAHFVTGGAYALTGGAAVIVTGIPVGIVIVISLRFDRRKS